MQDNARPHFARLSKIFLEENQVRVIFHPPHSPDLNPIEKIWFWLKNRVMKRKYDNIEELISNIQVAWGQLDIQLVSNFIDHHVKVGEKVMNNNHGQNNFKSE